MMYVLWFAVLMLAVLALVGAVAVRATLVNRPRTARALAEQSAAADRTAASIMLGEQDATGARDRLALATGCAFTIARLVPADSAQTALWNRGLFGIGAVPQHPRHDDPLRLAACLQYCLDLAHDELQDDGRSREAARRAVMPMGPFLDSGILGRIDGWAHLETHRRAGMRELAGETFGPAPLCPFCGFGVYDQTRLGCDRCAGDGELNRTVPAVPLPKRAAPDLRKSARRARDIEARAMTNVHAHTGSH